MTPAIEQDRAYWLKQLSEPPPCPKLPWDSERPPVRSFVRENVSAMLEPAAWRVIQDLAARLGATPEAVLLAALTVLLFRYSGQTDLIVGMLLSRDSSSNRDRKLVAQRTRLTGEEEVQHLVRRVAASLHEASRHLDMPCNAVSELPELQAGIGDEGLFNVALLFAQPGHVRTEQLASCALVLHAHVSAAGLRLDCDYDAELMTDATAKRLLGHLTCLLAAMAAEPRARLDDLNLLSDAERRQLLVDWNATETEIPDWSSIHRLIESQVTKTPDATALICRDRQLTYAQLNARANQVASRLSKLGVEPETVVGLCAERSLEMVVGLLGILKAGGAYLPLDPAYPAERLAYLIEDAQPKVLLTQEHLAAILPGDEALPDTSLGAPASCWRVGGESANDSGTAEHAGRVPALPVLRLDADWASLASEPDENVSRGVSPQHLAYVLYTSGSTGKPKGVMVEHRNVLNFFVGMDARIQYRPGATWLAVTSPSFDISVLELFWTLARGFRVVLFAGDEAGAAVGPRRKLDAQRSMEFSLFYFSSDQHDGPGGAYRLLTEGARFADEHGFSAVWTPERHFHEFGGLYPNPSVTSAALAMITRRVQLRSGSVVAPLHSPIRIAEEWAVVDNLSNGRAAISFASGWMPEDFALSPDSYAQRKELMVRYIDIVRRLWRGERVPMRGPLGKDVAVRVLPRPVQKELPVWLTAAGNPETFEMAGRLGMNLLTHLLGQRLEDVSKKVSLYRRAWKEAGHPGRGHVTLMLHTFVGDSIESVRAAVRGPLIEYLRKSTDLIKGYTWAFSAFKHTSSSESNPDFSKLPKEEMDAILEHAFSRYFETSGLFGTPESCLEIIETLRANDIDEAACLIDFGVDPEVVLEHLKHLDLLRQSASRNPDTAATDYTIPALIEHHNVTHFQCTPSMAGMLMLDPRSQAAFGRLQTLLIGGEAFPVSLAKQLRGVFNGELLNMYGPTETTIWSSTHTVPREPDRVPVGRPIANTQMFILDRNSHPVPVGIAGELLIGGAGVARGYLGRPELTAERFVCSPLGEPASRRRVSGESAKDIGTAQHAGRMPALPVPRLYRTGDLARYLPDGNIELLGRLDHQVKIRGHRVELGEIEALLNEHPAIRESAVAAKDTADGRKQLVAYVIPREGQKPVQNQLRRYTQEKLPEYMVPAKVVFMTAFPQTPNKKLDRNALPPVEFGAPESDRDFEAPATTIERALAGFWSELLSVSRVGRRDNFFELGGDSLLAMHLAAWVRERYNVELPLRSLFEHPTVAGLAEAVEALAWSSATGSPGAGSAEREEVEV